MICELTSRQKWLYRAIRNKISIEDLIQTSTAASASSSATNNLMNIVMQFRKVRKSGWLENFGEKLSVTPYFSLSRKYDHVTPMSTKLATSGLTTIL